MLFLCRQIFIVSRDITTRPRATCYMRKFENVCRHHAGHVVIGHYQRNGFFESLEILIFWPRHRPSFKETTPASQPAVWPGCDLSSRFPSCGKQSRIARFYGWDATRKTNLSRLELLAARSNKVDKVVRTKFYFFITLLESKIKHFVRAEIILLIKN